ncbi:MAG: SPASM domain-containing protein [Kineosporiaceae bacterium]|jgi:uncharacterized protein
MRSIEPLPRAETLCSDDVPGDATMLLHACEDCACAVSEASPPVGASRAVALSAKPGQPWVVDPDVVRVPVGRQRTALFNPRACGGVVVVNDWAAQICGFLEHPASIPATLDAFSTRLTGTEEALAKLDQAQIIYAAAEGPRVGVDDTRVLTAWLHITNACNLRCSYCYLRQTNEAMNEATGQAAIAAIMTSAASQGFSAVRLKYAGGEAALNAPVLQAVHRYAQDLARSHGIGLSAVLLTNGVHIPQTLLDWLKSQDVGVAVSLDGLGAYHDVQRPRANGAASSGSVERAIHRLVESGLAPHLSITITRLNAPGLADLVRFALERDLTFSFNFYRETPGRTTNLHCTPAELLSALGRSFEVIEELMPRWSVLGSILDRGQLLRRRERACGAGLDYLVIDQRGKLARCHMTIEETIGDVFSGDDILTRVRGGDATRLFPSVDRKTGCDACIWRYWCAGGCPLATQGIKGTTAERSPRCEVNQQLYPQALRLEGLRLVKYAVPHQASGR